MQPQAPPPEPKTPPAPPVTSRPTISPPPFDPPPFDPPPFAPPPPPGDQTSAKGDLGIGITVGILGNVLWMALMLATSLAGNGQAMLGLLFVGVSQFIWIGPLALYWHTQNQSRHVGGLMTVAGVVFLLNFVLVGGFVALIYTVCGRT